MRGTILTVIMLATPDKADLAELSPTMMELPATTAVWLLPQAFRVMAIGTTPAGPTA
jgi:hypothetical protein